MGASIALRRGKRESSLKCLQFAERAGRASPCQGILPAQLGTESVLRSSWRARGLTECHRRNRESFFIPRSIRDHGPPSLVVLELILVWIESARGWSRKSGRSVLRHRRQGRRRFGRLHSVSSPSIYTRGVCVDELWRCGTAL
jgi:hypothetical protein